MDYSRILSAANALGVNERIRLVEAIWDGIAAEEPAPTLTDVQRRELDRRLAEDDASPDDAIPWEVVNAEIRARLRS